jgi:hypothetical protein
VWSVEENTDHGVQTPATPCCFMGTPTQAENDKPAFIQFRMIKDD